jgi:Clp amino terminal domain, pathogenicity island component
MWQRFTERARRVVFFAQEEAARLGENYVGTEHLLLGLVRESDHVAARILDALGVSLGAIRAGVEKQVTRGQGNLGQDMQLTPRAKRVVDLAYEEARRLNNNYIGTEHLLLGLVAEEEGLGARVLLAQGVDLDRARAEVERLQEKEKKDVVEGTRLEAGPKPLRGDLGVLEDEDGRQQVEMAVSRAAIGELTEVMQTKDHHGYRDLVSGGRIRTLPAGTEVKLLRVDDPVAYYVRLLSGADEGQTGWVLRVQVRHTGPDTRPFPPPLDLREAATPLKPAPDTGPQEPDAEKEK